MTARCSATRCRPREYHQTGQRADPDGGRGHMDGAGQHGCQPPAADRCWVSGEGLGQGERGEEHDEDGVGAAHPRGDVDPVRPMEQYQQADEYDQAEHPGRSGDGARGPRPDCGQRIGAGGPRPQSPVDELQQCQGDGRPRRDHGHPAQPRSTQPHRSVKFWTSLRGRKDQPEQRYRSQDPGQRDQVEPGPGSAERRPTVTGGRRCRPPGAGRADGEDDRSAAGMAVVGGQHLPQHTEPAAADLRKIEGQCDLVGPDRRSGSSHRVPVLVDQPSCAQGRCQGLPEPQRDHPRGPLEHRPARRIRADQFGVRRSRDRGRPQQHHDDSPTSPAAGVRTATSGRGGPQTPVRARSLDLQRWQVPTVGGCRARYRESAPG